MAYHDVFVFRPKSHFVFHNAGGVSPAVRAVGTIGARGERDGAGHMGPRYVRWKA
ncbi:hypothetical protein QJS10_CPA09g01594 [Acorus calamus]|uniref:Uncharacterized protein n=1 Tax=Acorus calamus TaxID=4465 RepID=A0AAV9E560_ACOCL|nr:hypothetical protein QJS10_CPA09g01594 [Acorus calamus]